MPRVSIGLIGAGRIGRLHAENLAFRIPGVNLLVVSDIFLEAAHKCAADLYIPTATHDYQDFMENPDVEAVI